MRWYSFLLFGVLIVIAAGLVFRDQLTRLAFLPTSDTTRRGGAEGRIINIEEHGQVVARDLAIPWEIGFLPDESMLVTERPGRLVKIDQDRQVIPIEGVRHVGEGGLQGLAVHPRFSQNQFIYLYLTSEMGGGLINRVERYRLDGAVLHERTVIVDGIPGAQFHDGGRMAFGPDGLLYITTGDAGQPEAAQDTGSLAGKILRIGDDGQVPPDNPYGNAVYSFGHRNSQGLVWDEKSRLWATEHGRSGAQSGLDELNVISKGGNYGWPDSEGDTALPDTIAPAIHSGARDTWAPAGAAFWQGRIFFTGLRGQALYEADVSEAPPVVITHASGSLGRLRAIAVGPDGWLYISTSNRDGRGSAHEGDDVIFKLDPRFFE